MANKYSSGKAWDMFSKNERNKPKPFTYAPPKPTFSYDERDIKKYYDELLNRKDFTFDINNNALYNQVKDNFVKQGQLAMMDTVGQASSMTGGYGNSYAVSAGQQAYQQELDKLNDIVPEIYQLALEQYQMEGQNLLDKYGIATSERDTAYGMFRDKLTDYYTERDFAYGQHRDSVADYQSDRDYLYGVYADARDYEYQEGRDKVADQQWKKEYDLQVQKFAEDVRQFNMNYELSEKEFEEMCRQFALEYDLDVQQFEEDVRQYNASLAEEQRQFDSSLAYEKHRDSVADSQWAQEFAESQKRYDSSTDKMTADEFAEFISEGVKITDNVDVFDALDGMSGFMSGLSGFLGGNKKSDTTMYSEDTELTMEEEYMMNTLGDIFTKYGIEGNDEAILEALRDPALGLSEEEIQKYYSIFTR